MIPGVAEPVVAAAPFSAAAPAAQAALEAPLEVKATVAEPLTLGATPLRVALALPALPLAAAAPQAAAAPAVQMLADRSYYLVLGGIKVQADAGAATYNVHFDLPEGVAPSTDDLTYVGTLNFFGSEAGHDHGDTEGHRAVFNVTDAVKKLQAAGKLSNKPTVTLVPRGEGLERRKSGPSTRGQRDPNKITFMKTQMAMKAMAETDWSQQKATEMLNRIMAETYAMAQEYGPQGGKYDDDRYKGYLKLTVYTAGKLAPYQTPMLSTVKVGGDRDSPLMVREGVTSKQIMEELREKILATGLLPSKFQTDLSKVVDVTPNKVEGVDG